MKSMMHHGFRQSWALACLSTEVSTWSRSAILCRVLKLIPRSTKAVLNFEPLHCHSLCWEGGSPFDPDFATFSASITIDTNQYQYHHHLHHLHHYHHPRHCLCTEVALCRLTPSAAEALHPSLQLFLLTALVCLLVSILWNLWIDFDLKYWNNFYNFEDLLGGFGLTDSPLVWNNATIANHNSVTVLRFETHYSHSYHLAFDC